MLALLSLSLLPRLARVPSAHGERQEGELGFARCFLPPKKGFFRLRGRRKKKNKKRELKKENDESSKRERAQANESRKSKSARSPFVFFSLFSTLTFFSSEPLSSSSPSNYFFSTAMQAAATNMRVGRQVGGVVDQREALRQRCLRGEAVATIGAEALEKKKRSTRKGLLFFFRHRSGCILACSRHRFLPLRGHDRTFSSALHLRNEGGSKEAKPVFQRAAPRLLVFFRFDLLTLDLSSSSTTKNKQL